MNSCFCFFTDGKQHKARELDMITLRDDAPQSYMIVQSAVMTSRTLISKIHCRLSANQKRDSEFNV